MSSTQIVTTVKHVLLSRVCVSDEGQDLLEYALLVALIVLMAIGAVTTVGNTIHNVFWTAIATSV